MFLSRDPFQGIGIIIWESFRNVGCTADAFFQLYLAFRTGFCIHFADCGLSNVRRVEVWSRSLGSTDNFEICSLIIGIARIWSRVRIEGYLPSGAAPLARLTRPAVPAADEEKGGANDRQNDTEDDRQRSSLVIAHSWRW